MTPVTTVNSFADAFELPFVRKLGDVEYTLPRLNTRDYLPWLSELTASRRAALKSISPGMGNVNPVDKYNIDRSIVLLECTCDDLVGLVGTAEGTIKVIELAAKKAGWDAAKTDAFISAVSPMQLRRDAYRISGLVSYGWYMDVFHPINKKTGQPEEIGDDPNVSGGAATTASAASESSSSSSGQAEAAA